MVSSSRRTNRKIQLSAPAHLRRKLMSSPLNRELRAEHGIRSIPVVKGDEVQIVRGSKKGAEGRVTQVYRKKWVIHVDRVEREKAKEQTVPIPISPSNVVITKLKLDKSRKVLIARKAGKAPQPAADAQGDVEMKA